MFYVIIYFILVTVILINLVYSVNISNKITSDYLIILDKINLITLLRKLINTVHSLTL